LNAVLVMLLDFTYVLLLKFKIIKILKLFSAFSVVAVDFEAEVFCCQLLAFTYFAKPNCCIRFL
jgi:hypothetical protein